MFHGSNYTLIQECPGHCDTLYCRFSLFMMLMNYLTVLSRASTRVTSDGNKRWKVLTLSVHPSLAGGSTEQHSNLRHAGQREKTAAVAAPHYRVCFIHFEVWATTGSKTSGARFATLSFSIGVFVHLWPWLVITVSLTMVWTDSRISQFPIHQYFASRSIKTIIIFVKL